MIYSYPHPELFEGFEKPNFEEYSGKIILWGAGRIGGIAVHCLKSKNVEICAFCDSSEEKWGTEYCGYKVISPEEMKCEYPDAVVIITNVYYDEVSSRLREERYEKVFDCSSFFMEIDFTEYEFWMSPEYAIRNVEMYLQSLHRQIKKTRGIDQVYLTVTTKCTLRCKECCAFVPYVKEPCLYDSEEIMSDFFAVLDAMGKFRVVNFYGGEPLLHPELGKMISKLKNEKRIERVSIITNGTIVPNEELLVALREEKRSLIRISDYGSLSSKRNEIISVLKQNDIAYEITNYKYWEKNNVIGIYDDSEEELTKKFLRCRLCNFFVLQNRKVYICGAASAVDNIGAFPVMEDNYVDLRKYAYSSVLLREKLISYVERTGMIPYLDACKYCSGSYSTNFDNKIPAAEQTKGILELPRLF